MPAFMQLDGVPGEATDAGHKDWIHIQSVSAPITRSIPAGAKDQQRTKGDTTLGDIVVTRQVDKSSPKLALACAAGNFYKTVSIDFCTMVKGKNEPYLTYRLHDVIVTSHSLHANGAADPLPSEEITLGYTGIEWNYVVVDPKTGDKKGNVPAKYTLGTNDNS